VTVSSGGAVIASSASGSQLLLRQGSDNRVAFSSAGGVDITTATSQAFGVSSGGAVSVDSAASQSFSLSQGSDDFLVIDNAGELAMTTAAGTNMSVAAGGSLDLSGDHIKLTTGVDFTVTYNASGDASATDVIYFDDVTGALAFETLASGASPTLTLKGKGVEITDSGSSPTKLDFNGGLDLDTAQMALTDSGSGGVSFVFSGGAEFSSQSGSSLSFTANKFLEFTASVNDISMSASNGDIYITTDSGNLEVSIANNMNIDVSNNIDFVSGGVLKIEAGTDLKLFNIPTSDPGVFGAVWRDGTTLKLSI